MSDDKKILDNETSFDLTQNKQPIDFSDYDVLKLEMCDLGTYKTVRFKKNSEVDLGGAEPLPKEIDVSRCTSVDLSGCDLSTLKKPIIMKEGSTFNYNARLQNGFSINNIPPLTNADFSHSAKVSIDGTDLSNYKELKFAPNSDVSIANTKNIPANIDFSHCKAVKLSGCDLANQPNLHFKDGAAVNLSSCTNYPEDLDLSNCDSVTILDTDLSQIKNLKFKDNAIVNLSGCTNIPENIDFSNCKAVYLSNTNLSAIKDLKLKDGACLDVSNCTALPQKADFDKCAYLNLGHTDLFLRSDIKFRDDAEVYMGGAQNIPDEVDFSPCAKLNLNRCNLGSDIIGGTRKITFRDGAEVSLQQCTNLPENMDFSQCSALNLSGCDLSGQTHLTLKENARVAIIGIANIPANNNLNQCCEVWVIANQAKKLDLGDAHVVLSGLGPDKVDISKLNTVTTAQCHDEILGTSMMTLLGTKEFIFKDHAQYQEYLANPDNLRIPENVTIIFADEQKKDLAQELSSQNSEMPYTKADAQNYRIDKATERHTEQAKNENRKISQNSTIMPPADHTR